MIYGKWTKDDEHATKGLNDFTLSFMKQNNIKNNGGRNLSGPYTNVIGCGNWFLIHRMWKVISYIHVTGCGK